MRKLEEEFKRRMNSMIAQAQQTLETSPQKDKGF
jgi:hypothetical protein